MKNEEFITIGKYLTAPYVNLFSTSVLCGKNSSDLRQVSYFG